MVVALNLYRAKKDVENTVLKLAEENTNTFEKWRGIMGKAKMIGMIKPYTPNNKMDRKKHKHFPNGDCK